MPTDEERQGHESSSIPNLLSIMDLSLVIPNKVSMARDQLAGERNYLTFLRFSCTLIVLGKDLSYNENIPLLINPHGWNLLGFTMILKFRLPFEDDLTDSPPWESDRDQITTPLGYCFVAIGFCLFLYGFVRYYLNQRALVRQVNYIQAGWFSMTVIAVLASFVIGVMILATIHSMLFTNPS